MFQIPKSVDFISQDHDQYLVLIIDYKKYKIELEHVEYENI